jgi:predicted MPP superfamily phosphohydrolase
VTMFLIIVLSIYLLLNFYVIRRGWQATWGMGPIRSLILMLFLIMVLSYPIGLFLERSCQCIAAEVLVRIGAFYLALIIYLFLIVLLLDIIRLGNHFFHFFPAAILKDPQRAAHFTFFGVLGIAALIVIGGHINALHPRIRTFNLKIAKQAGNLKSLNIVMASDIHLGSITRDSRLEAIVKRINKLDPDLVLLPGDTVDVYIPQREASKMVSTLQKIHAPYGVFAVTGNHEYYGGVQKNIEYLSQGNVTVLQDRAVQLADAFFIIGRKDLTALRFGEERKPLREILENVDLQLPLILLDHQPFHLEEAEQCGIDLQISGHTHAGQLFPLNLINKKIYEQYWGYWKKGNTQYYISCGVGTWGPPVRTGSIPEIIQIKLTFK